MKANKIKKIVGGALFAVLLLFGALAPATNAQVRVFRPHREFFVHRGFFPYYYPYYSYPYYYATDPIAYQKESGYSDGISKGKSDAQHGLAYQPTSHKHYTGSKSLAYREAFLQGYADGFQRRS